MFRRAHVVAVELRKQLLLCRFDFSRAGDLHGIASVLFR
jgi:hypothetical protein